MDTARKWEIGKLIASPNTDTDKAIKQLTDQIAQLSINLAQKQQPANLSVNYAVSSKQANPIKQPPICHYCGRTEHFIAHCRTKKNDQNRERGRNRQSNNNNNRQRNSYRNRSRGRDNYNRDRSRSRNRDNRND